MKKKKNYVFWGVIGVLGLLSGFFTLWMNVAILKPAEELVAVKQTVPNFITNLAYKEPFVGQEGYCLALDMEPPQPIGWEVVSLGKDVKKLEPVFDSTKRIFTRAMMGEHNPLIFADTYLGKYVQLRMKQSGVDILGSLLAEAWLGEYYEWKVSLKYPRLRNIDIVEPTINLVLYNNDFRKYFLKLKFRFIPVQKRRDDAGEIIYHARELSLADLNEKFTFDPPLSHDLWDSMDEINSDFILKAELTITDSRNNIVLSETHSYTDEIDPNQKHTLEGAALSSISFLERFSLVKTWHNSGKLANPNRRKS